MNQDDFGKFELVIDVNALRSQLREASSLAIERLAGETSDLRVYGFVLCAYWDGFDHVFDFFPSAATEEEVDQDLRWSPFDWPYERIGEESFASICEFVRSAYNQEPQLRDREDFMSLFHGDVLSQLVLARHDLRTDGVFNQFSAATVFCAQPESDGWLERYSGKLLNTDSLDAEFLRQFAPIDPRYDEHDSTFRRFRDRLRQGGRLPDVWQ
jgi:hypothetical protein